MIPYMLEIGGLFSGLGNFEFGLVQGGLGPVKWVVEIHPKRRAHLYKRFPEAERYSDVQLLDWFYDLCPVDILCGGFPCQDLSIRGNRGGIDAKRSGLWSYFHQTIRYLRPRYALVENVGGLRTLGMGRVLGDLAASGYDAEWESIPARAFGAPQVRDRVWIVAYKNNVMSVDCERALAHARFEWLAALGGPGNLAYKSSRRKTYSAAHARAFREARAYATSKLDLEPVFERDSFDDAAAASMSFWLHEPRVDRVADGPAGWLDRNRALGDSLTPQIPRYLATRLLDREARIAAA